MVFGKVRLGPPERSARMLNRITVTKPLRPTNWEPQQTDIRGSARAFANPIRGRPPRKRSRFGRTGSGQTPSSPPPSTAPITDSRRSAPSNNTKSTPSPGGGRVLAGAIDRQQMPGRLIQVRAAASRHEQEVMAELRRAVDPGAAAGIDPQLKGVAILQPRSPAPRRRPFAGDVDAEADRLNIPSDADFGKPLLRSQRGKVRDTATGRQFQPIRRPLTTVVLQFQFEPKQVSRVDQRSLGRRSRTQGINSSRANQTGRPKSQSEFCRNPPQLKTVGRRTRGEGPKN